MWYLQTAPAPSSVSGSLPANTAICGGSRCFVQQTNPKAPTRHQVCNTRSLEVTVPLFFPLALQVSCLPDQSSGPQAAAIDTHIPNPMGFSLLLAGVRTVTGELICHQEHCTDDSPMRLPHTLPPQQTSHGKLVALRSSK